MFKNYIYKHKLDMGYKYLSWPKQLYDYQLTLYGNYKNKNKLTYMNKPNLTYIGGDDQFKILNLIEMITGQRPYIEQKKVIYRFRNTLFITVYKVNIDKRGKEMALYFFSQILFPAYRQRITYNKKNKENILSNNMPITGNRDVVIFYMPFPFLSKFYSLDWHHPIPIFIHINFNMFKYKYKYKNNDDGKYIYMRYNYQIQQLTFVWLSRYVNYYFDDSQLLTYYKYKKLNYKYRQNIKINKKNKK
jgi:hypothetical protein